MAADAISPAETDFVSIFFYQRFASETPGQGEVEPEVSGISRNLTGRSWRSIPGEIGFHCCQLHAGCVPQNRERGQACLKEEDPERAHNTHSPTPPVPAQPDMT